MIGTSRGLSGGLPRERFRPLAASCHMRKGASGPQALRPCSPIRHRLEQGEIAETSPQRMRFKSSFWSLRSSLSARIRARVS
jgi:hypothetical protein